MSPAKSILVRADASPSIGTGHVVRCLALADELRNRGWAVSFASRRLPTPLLMQVKSRGHDVILIPEDISSDSEPSYLRQCGRDTYAAVLTDHYGVDAAWQRSAQSLAPNVAAVDDQATVELGVALVVNQNLGYSVADYDGLVPPQCRRLIGARYAMVRREFALERISGVRVRERVRHILVFLSGGDMDDITRRVVQALGSLDYALDVVLGSAYRHGESLRRLAATLPSVTIHENTTRMARLMARADLAVGAPSSASWERCCLGLPVVTITLAENQRRVADALNGSGASISLGWHDKVTESAILEAVAELAANTRLLREMSAAAALITDGKGALRVADAICELTN